MVTTPSALWISVAVLALVQFGTLGILIWLCRSRKDTPEWPQGYVIPNSASVSGIQQEYRDPWSEALEEPGDRENTV